MMGRVPELRLTAQKRRPERANLFLDGDYWRAASYDSIALLEISPGELTAEQVERLSEALDGRDAFDVAMRALSFRARTAGEIIDRLRQRQHEPHAIEYALGRLKALGVLDDEAVARNRAEGLRARGRGPRFVSQALAQLGIERDMVEVILAEVYAEADMDALIVQTLGRAVDLDTPIDRRTRTRLQGRLMRAGHSGEDIRRVLDKIPAVVEDNPRGAGSSQRPARTISDERLEREVARCFPAAAGGDYGERRRAMGWCARRGVGHEEFRLLLERIAEGEPEA